MMTIEDLRNPERKSGFDRVGTSDRDLTDRNLPFSANWREGKKVVKLARRATAEEAAQDYCDHVNGGWHFDAQPMPPLRSAGHQREVIQRARNEEKMVLNSRLKEIEDEERSTSDCPGYVYLIGEEHSDFAFKIGHARTSAQNRMISLQTGNPRKLVLIGSFEGSLEDEAAMHARYAGDNILQEWFHGSHELFSEFGASWENWRGNYGPISLDAPYPEYKIEDGFISGGGVVAAFPHLERA